MASVVSNPSIGNVDVDGLFYGTKWTGSLTFAFPTALPSYYTAGQVPGFTQVSLEQRNAVRGILGGSNATGTSAYGSVASLTNLTISETSSFNTLADIEIFQADSIYGSNIGTARVVDFPQLANGGDDGDVVFDSVDSGGSARNPVYGDYYYHQHMHELGHALGLKHSHDPSYGSGVAVSGYYDSMEYTVMSYRSYTSDPLVGGYSNEQYGYAQTFMALDILALQQMYGADYTTNSGNTVYTWNSATGQMSVNGVGQQTPGANRVFLTVWDGNGNDTYDMSNYTNGVYIDLRAGNYSVTSNTQRAYLGDGNYAHGTVYNAFLFNGDARSYIENAVGGSGSDLLVGNAVANRMIGNNGADTFYGLDGDDIFNGGAGADVVYGGGGTDTLDLSYEFAGTSVTLESYYAVDGYGSVDTLVDVENIIGTNATYSGATFSDYLIGNYLGNLIDGRAGIDYVVGGAGNDVLYGGTGNDYVYGGTESDVIVLSQGNDVAYGGSGSDIFYVLAGSDTIAGEFDYIGDFEVGVDYFLVQGSLAGQIGAIDYGANTALIYAHVGGGNYWYETVTGAGVSAAWINASFVYF